ncbi:nuclear pore complex protein Nup214 [Megalops cyprinoides]|uniref:nuclear pore complex protein Nup214 n=1 Tax=Megalops cyprinoides TaxID=118141 RepID=UPI001863A45F|nr:nuclear pore complex protein Nup214 [Megalops cyprinoides]
MSDDPDAVPEREMKDFQFRQMKKIRVFDAPDDIPKDRCSLLVISNKFGLTFVGQDRTLKMFPTQDIIEANKVEGNSNEIVEGLKALQVPVDLPMHHLALSSDELTLSVCGMSEEEGLLLAFYDMRVFHNKARPEKLPFATMRPAVDPGASVQDLKWNPVQASILAACLSDGSMMVLEVTDKVTVQAQLPASVGITCVCWSPKGKQVAAGKQDATVIQYTPALQEKKVIPCPSFYSSDNPVKVLDVLWLSTFSFAVAYAAADGSPETPPELVVVSLPKKDEKRDERYLNFNDLVYGTCTERQHHYFLSHIEDWDLVLAASAASIEVSIIAKQEDKTNWELWILEDASRAELPVTLNNDDTLPVGVAIDYTSQEEIHISDEKTLPPVPTLMLLSTDGVLCPFSLLNLNPGVKQLSSAAVGLPPEGERLPSAGSVAAPAPPPAAAASVAPATAPVLRPPAAITPTPAPTAAPTAPAAAPASASSSGFSFGLSGSQNAGPSIFSLGSAASPAAPSGLSLGSASFSFTAQPAKPASEPPASSAFSFSAPPAKPPAESGPAPAPAPQRLATASPVTVFKTPAEPATPAVKVNLNDRFLAVETPAAPTPQQFSFTSTSTSTPKPTFPGPTSQSTPLPSKPAAAPGPTRPAQSSAAPSAGTKTAPVTQVPASTPAPQAALSVKALEKQLQQRKDSDPVMAGILEEIAHFQKELDDLKTRSDKADFRVGTTEEMHALRKESEDLHVFTLEIKETTESLHGDISSLKTTLLEGFAGAEDAKAQSELNRDRGYLQLLYKKPLDPRSDEQLKEIRRLYQYVKFAVEDVNDVLDLEWEKHLEKKKKQKHLIVPEREALFTALANNLDIIQQQEQRLQGLVKTLQSLRLYGKARDWSLSQPAPASTQPGSLDSELESLRDSLLKASLETTPKVTSKSPAKMSPVKQSQLRNFLSKRQTPPVRSTAPANLSRSAFLSPKYYEDLDDVSSTSSLSQTLDPEEAQLAEEEEEEPVPAPIQAPTIPRHPTVVRTPSIQPGFGMQSTPFSKVHSGLGPIISPVLTGKMNVSGADSTAFATKTVKHGAPPTERTTPVTMPAQQAAATAALRRQMANQKPAVSTSLTESTLKTVPQVVNVQELKDKGSALPVSAVISSSVPAPVAQVNQQIQAKRNSSQNALKVSGPSAEVSAASQSGFMFGAPLKPEAPVVSAAPAASSSGPALTEQTSKAFSFSATPAGSFTFSSLSTASVSASQAGGASQGKDVSQASKFTFGNSVAGGTKMVFGTSGEAPFSFTPKSTSPALGRTSTPTPPPSMSSEPVKPAPAGSALKVESQALKTGTAGETLGSFSGLRVGQGEEEAKEAPRLASVGFSFGSADNGAGLGAAEFSFGGGFQQGKPAEPTPSEADSSAPAVDLPKTAPAIFGSTSTPATVSATSVFKPPEPAAPATTKPAFTVSQPSSLASAATSFSSLLAAPLPPASTGGGEEPKSASPPATEPAPAAETQPTQEEPSPESPTPPGSTPPPADDSAVTSAAAQAVIADATATASKAPEKPPTPPSPAPSPAPSTSPTPTPAAPPAEGAPAADSSAAPEATAPSPAPQPASAFGQALSSDKPGSIFAQPAVSTDSTTLGISALTTVITTVAPAAPPAPEPTPATAPTPTPAPAAAATATTTASIFGQPPAAASTTAPAATGFGSGGFGSGATGGFGKPAFGQVSGFGQPAATGAGGFSFGQSAFGSSPGFGQPAAAAAAPPASSSGGGLFGSASTSSASSFSFGQMTTSSSSTAGGSGTGLFGQSTTPAFGQQSSGFGQGSVFGSNTTTTSSTGFSFGQPAAFGSTSTPSVFGQQASGGSVFGQQAGSGGGLFGSGTSGPAGPSGGSGGFFSGLGGKPSEDAANKNPFGSTSSGGFGQANQAGSSSLFGNSGAKTFGFGTSSFGEQKPSGTFSTGGGSVAVQGFGSFTSPAKTGGFGSAPVFSSPPSFGGGPAFGSTSAFGAAPSFSSPMGSGTGKVFGEGTAAASVGGFGFASASNTPTFGSLANQSAPSFGGLAQQGSGFSGQSGGFSGFGSSGAFSGGFGSSNQQSTAPAVWMMDSRVHHPNS